MSAPDAPPGRDRPLPPDAVYWRLVAALAGAGFGLLALFVAAPGLDLWAAGLFHDGAGFPLGRSAGLRVLRAVYHGVFVASCAAAVAGLLARLLRPNGPRAPLAVWAFVAGLMALGPGLIANALFKEHWGRARPDAVTAFGGAREFSGPFALSDQCAGNCAFVSGEGAAAAAVAAAAVALFWPLLRGARAQAAGAVALALWLAGAALIRMAPGKHFLSDSLFAFVLMGLTACGLYAALGLGSARRGVTPALLAADLAEAAARARDAARSFAERARARLRHGAAQGPADPARAAPPAPGRAAGD